MRGWILVVASSVALSCVDDPPADSGATASTDAASGAASPSTPTDAGLSDADKYLAAITSGRTDFVNPFEGELSPIRRGEYLVRHAAACMECHTPRAVALKFDETRLLSGIDNLFDLVPDDDAMGALSSRNLTPDPETGLGNWTDREIKDAFQRGVGRDGRVLHPLMPYWVYHNMTDADADAIVLFLRSIPAVSHAIADPQPLPVPLARPAAFVPDDRVPSTTLDPGHPDFPSAQRGRYLASAVSLCLYCHTEEAPAGSELPIDMDRAFLGRRMWHPIALGQPTGPETPFIPSKNVTPTANGLADWTHDDVLAAIKWGRSRDGSDLCDPMPFGPAGSFGLMLDGDALDIARYVTTLPPQDNGEFEACCSSCHREVDAAFLASPMARCGPKP